MATSSEKLAILAIALLFSSISQAARTTPADPSNTHAKEISGGDEVCNGVDEDECLVRRTLTAHTDYIYTQGKGNRGP